VKNQTIPNLLAFKEINYHDNKVLKQALDIYLTHFPPQEIRPLEKTVSMIQKDDNYHVLVSLQHETVIGVSLLYMFPSLKYELLDYMAIIKEFQGRGIGRKLFNFTFNIFSSRISDGIGLLMEIQKDNVQNIEKITFEKTELNFI